MSHSSSKMSTAGSSFLYLCIVSTVGTPSLSDAASGFSYGDASSSRKFPESQYLDVFSDRESQSSLTLQRQHSDVLTTSLNERALAWLEDQGSLRVDICAILQSLDTLTFNPSDCTFTLNSTVSSTSSVSEDDSEIPTPRAHGTGPLGGEHVLAISSVHTLAKASRTTSTPELKLPAHGLVCNGCSAVSPISTMSFCDTALTTMVQLIHGVRYQCACCPSFTSSYNLVRAIVQFWLFRP
jgi:hypothetical protein